MLGCMDLDPSLHIHVITYVMLGRVCVVLLDTEEVLGTREVSVEVNFEFLSCIDILNSCRNIQTYYSYILH